MDAGQNIALLAGSYCVRLDDCERAFECQEKAPK
jgi:hypothetical protein